MLRLSIKTKNRCYSAEALAEMVKKAPIVTTIEATPTMETIVAILAAIEYQRPLLLQNPHQSFPILDIRSPGLYFYTSGSTGKPKVVHLSYDNIYYSALGTQEALGLSSDDTWQLTLPLFHVGGVMILARMNLAGGCVALGTLDEIAELMPTYISLVPTQLSRILCKAPSTCRYIVGGAPLPHALRERAHHLDVIPTYGMTETSSMVTLNGQVLPYRTIDIASDGEILVSGKTLFQGYVEHEAPKIYATGDIGELSHSGELTVIGRKGRMLIKGGENIHPEEIEKALYQLPSIEEAVVVKAPCPEYGEVPVAFVKADPFDAAAIKSELKKFIPTFKLPSHIHPLPQYDGLKPSLKSLEASLVSP